MMRDTTSCGSVWARPQSSEPSENTRMAPPNTRRVPKRSQSQGLMGMKTARVST